MKNPNGYGSVVKLSGNRRRPYAVRKTVGWNEKGHPIYKTLGYCKTRKEGNILLAEYNKQPWDIDTAAMTLGELFERWKEKKAPLLGAGNAKNLIYKYKRIEHLSGKRYSEIRYTDMQDSVDACPSQSIKSMTRNLWKHLDKYAYELDIINKRYSDTLMSEAQAESDRTPWEPEQIRALFKEDSELSRIALVYIYTGLRAQELLSVDLDKVDLNEGYLIAGSKTAAGKDRYIPIHPAILPIISGYVERGYVFNGSYSRLYAQWAKWTDKLIHECRHTTETELDRAGANRKCVDMILGHKSSEVGQRVYNHKTTSELQEAIRLIPDYSH